MSTHFDGNDDGGPLLADCRTAPGAMNDEFTQPRTEGGQPEEHGAYDSETLAGDGEGDVATAVMELPKAAEVSSGTTTKVIGEAESAAADSAANSSREGESVSDEEQAVPQLSKQALGSLLDELTGELVPLEAFGGMVDDRARENEWLGRHTEISLAVFRAELAKTGKCTFSVDENGVLLDDPVKFRLALEMGAQITLRFHQGLSEAKKSNFILLTQGRERVRTEAENRELKRRIIRAALLQGLTYESIAEIAGVHANTVRNIETRAANDPDSKLVNTKKDRRLTWSTPENVAEAYRLRAEEKKNNSQIAKTLGTTPATIGKLFKTPSPPAKAKIGEEPKTSSETAPDQSPPPPSHVDTTRAPDDGIPNVVRLYLEHRGLRGVLADKAYAKLLKPQQDDAREKIEGLAKHKDELLRSFLYHREAAAFAESELEKQLLAAGKEGAA